MKQSKQSTARKSNKSLGADGKKSRPGQTPRVQYVDAATPVVSSVDHLQYAIILLVIGLITIVTYLSYARSTDTALPDYQAQSSTATPTSVAANNAADAEQQRATKPTVDASKVQAEDLARQAKVRSLHKGLQLYLQKTGWFPSIKQLSDESWVKTHFTAVYSEDLTTAPGKAGNSLTDAEATTGAFSYRALDTVQSPCNTEPCASYELSVRLASNDTVFTIKSTDNLAP